MPWLEPTTPRHLLVLGWPWQLPRRHAHRHHTLGIAQARVLPLRCPCQSLDPPRSFTSYAEAVACTRHPRQAATQASGRRTQRQRVIVSRRQDLFWSHLQSLQATCHTDQPELAQSSTEDGLPWSEARRWLKSRCGRRPRSRQASVLPINVLPLALRRLALPQHTVRRLRRSVEPGTLFLPASRQSQGCRMLLPAAPVRLWVSLWTSPLCAAAHEKRMVMMRIAAWSASRAASRTPLCRAVTAACAAFVLPCAASARSAKGPRRAS